MAGSTEKLTSSPKMKGRIYSAVPGAEGTQSISSLITAFTAATSRSSGNSGMAVAVMASVVSGAVIFCERLFPFALFSRRDPPPVVRFVARHIPSMVIAILIVYSLKDADPLAFPFGIPQLAGIGAALLLNLLSGNYMLTIFGSTALYMVLSRVM